MGLFDAINEFFNGPQTSKGDFRVKGDLAAVDPRAITPNDRSTPGLYYSSDAVRKFETAVFKTVGGLTKQDIDELEAMVNKSKEQVELTTEYKKLAQQLSKNETKITRNFAQLKPYVARQHVYQNKEHNKMLTGMDSAAVQYQANRTGRLKGSAKLRQIVGQMQQQQRQLRG